VAACFNALVRPGTGVAIVAISAVGVEEAGGVGAGVGRAKIAVVTSATIAFPFFSRRPTLQPAANGDAVRLTFRYASILDAVVLQAAFAAALAAAVGPALLELALGDTIGDALTIFANG